MATDAVRHGSRAQKQQAQRAAKDRRAKILLGVGGLLLLVVLALEVPKTMSHLHQAPAQPVESTPVTTTPAAQSAVGSHATDLKAVAKLAAKDPFVVQVGPAPTTGVVPTLATAPQVSRRLVAKDPFVQQLVAADASPGAAPAVTAPARSGKAGSYGSGKSGATAAGGYIVMVASVPVASGKTAAEHEATRARGRGVQNVKIVGSSSYPTLREGFYAVYSGPFSTLSSALAALEKVRGHGYPSAYTRRLAH